MARSGIIAGCVILGTVGWYLASTRQGHDWGDDFALYISHARNLAEGRPYAQTGYIYNPAYPSLSPRTYPPVLPLLLAPVYRCFGLNLFALKAELILLYGLFLVVFCAAFRKELPAGYVIAILLLLSLNPFLWDYKDRIMSEVPFFLFTYLALYLLACAHDQGRSPRARTTAALLAGVALYLACGTRSIGVVLLPCVLIEGWLRRRQPGRVVSYVLSTFVLGVLVQRMLLPFDGSYLDQVMLDPSVLAGNVVWLAKAVGLYADNGRSLAGLVVSVLVVGGLGLTGFVARARRGITSCEIFAILYPLAIATWPSTGSSPRFLMPLAPLGLVYACYGLRHIGEIWGPWWERVPGTVLAVGVLAVYGLQYRHAELGAFRQGIGNTQSVALFDYVKSAVPPDAVLVFQKPRAMALLTGRRASAIHAAPDDADVWRYVEKIGATHVVVDQGLFGSASTVLGPFAQRNAKRLRPVFHNADFTVYEVKTAAADLHAGR